MTCVELGNAVKVALRQRILPELGISGAALEGLTLCGSRATGQERADSDVDAVALIHKPDRVDFRAEYFGTIHVAEGSPSPLPLELKILDRHAMMKMAETDPLYRSRALSKGVILFDRTGTLLRAQSHSKNRIKNAIQALKAEIELQDAAALRLVLQNNFSQAPGILSSGSSTTRLCRFSEFLLDFYLQVQTLLLATSANVRESAKPGLLEGLVHAKSDRGARFLDASRTEVAPWFAELSETISRIWDFEPPGVTYKIMKSLEAMNNAFLALTGEPLLLAPGDLPEVLVVVSS